jgi:tetratricopeptide (TPR) repeat protein
MLKAAAILEPLLEKQPNHPGIAHYLIHAYDAPPLANRGLKAARSYAKIAPAVPHALHMPSHTFTRLGYWQESIDTNRLSAEAARKANAPGEELHAYDYQAYAYLQTGQDQAAKQVLDTAEQVRARIQSDLVYAGAGGYALAAMPARYTLERGDWAGAAALTVHPSGVAYVDAMTHFARALGAARSGRDTSAAAPDIAALAKIAADLVAKGDHYWSTAVTVQRLGASAWLANAKGNADEAVRLMREAADLEDTIEKSAVSPGPIAPARELLGELLLALKKPAAALVEFEKSAQKEPNRFRGVYGAAQAAAQAGQQEKARTLYTQLLQICQKGDTPGRAELADARRAAGGPSQ